MISIILPAFNCINYIERCIKSVLSQSYTDFELIIIDDGSTDGTGLICDKYQVLDSRIRVVHQKNKGVSESRNLGLQLSKGEFIAFIDQDDWVSPVYLQSLHESIKKGDYSVSMVLYKKTDHYSIPSSEKPYSVEEISGLQIRQSLFEIEKYEEPYGFIWAKLYKKEIIQGLKFKNVIGEDIDFSFQVSYRIKKAIVIREFMYFWYQHSASQFRNINPQKIFSSVECYYQILQNIQQDEDKTKSLCLIRLYKLILSVRYNAEVYKNKNLSDEINYKNSKIVKETQKELINNKNIPVYYRTVLLLFYYQPYLYKFFRKVVPLIKR